MAKQAYSRRFDDAMNLAVEAFRDKFRKQTQIPYITHLIAVCATVGEHGGDEDQLIAALLHDYLEDIPGATASELQDRFGERVAAYVIALSDTTVHPKPPWKQRKVSYLAHLRDEAPDLKLISAADKLHNCRSVIRDHNVMGEKIFDRFSVPKEETLWYFRAVLEALETNWRHPILDELRDAVNDLHRVSEVPI
jgi:(p)ppGpp synthase/HD superfamily hydrolase